MTEPQPALWQRNPVRIGAAVVLAIALLVALRGGEDEAVVAATADQPLLLVPADLVVVGRGPVAGGIRVNGTLEPVNRTTVNARVGGVVLEVAVREGTAVAPGDLLVRQDPADLLATLAQAEAQLSSAKVDLQLVEALEQKKTLLYRNRYLSEVDYQAALGETEVKRALVRVQEANVAIARKAVSDGELRAPVAGLIAERHVEPGTRVAPGQALLTLVSLGEMELAAGIPARDVPQVRPGNDVLFSVDGHGNRQFRGRIVRINPMASSGSRTIQVYARVANTDGALRGGMFASGHIAVGGLRRDVLRIPQSALRRIDGEERVWLVRNGKLAQQPVVTGVQDTGTGLVEIRNGLAEGEQVIVTDIGNRKPGIAVTVSAPVAR